MERDAHSWLSFLSDAALACVSACWVWMLAGAGRIVVSTSQWVVVIEPEAKAWGTLLIAVLLIVRIMIAVRDLLARFRARATDR